MFNPVYCASIKGPGVARVYLIGRNEYMPCKWANQEWEQMQEQNLQYIAVTRAKETLVEVMVPETNPETGEKSKQDRDWWDLTQGEER